MTIDTDLSTNKCRLIINKFHAVYQKWITNQSHSLWIYIQIQANVRASGTGVRVAHTRPTALDMSLLGAPPPNPWLIIRVGLSQMSKC